MTGGGEGGAPVEEVLGTGVPVRGNDIDTDQIIPARYLKAVSFSGLGRYAFRDQRFDEDGEPTDHPFNRECHRGASVLVVNANFGCGSSREHAPQALSRWGIEAVVGESFAEIFAGNCLALGIPAVTADPADVAALQDRLEAEPDTEIRVDVAGEALSWAGVTRELAIPATRRRALVEGLWDSTALMRANAGAVRETAESLPYVTPEGRVRPGSGHGSPGLTAGGG